MRNFNFSILDIDPCLSEHHTIIDDFRRSTKYRPKASERRLCDNDLIPGWYRLKINGTDADLPTKCIKVISCKIHLLVYIQHKDFTHH